jgi:FkbM family methyltransferase
VAIPPAAEPLAPRAPLLLPGDRKVELEMIEGDISVSAALIASAGVWEPHVQRFMAGLVKPDWVCADIGANIGVHTLSLAALACQGKVYAFEADPANFAVLLRNTSELRPPAGEIEALHLALWERTGSLTTGGADEVAGCSFVADGAIEAGEIERRLRAVIGAEALSGTELHVRRSEVHAVALDDWAESLARLDFIKLDVEGAEAWVVRGADRTIRRHRPVLLVEYNPACAATYFHQPADGLYHELKSRFHSIHAMEEDGSLTMVADWDALQARLQAGKGWEDLVCLPGNA